MHAPWPHELETILEPSGARARTRRARDMYHTTDLPRDVWQPVALFLFSGIFKLSAGGLEPSFKDGSFRSNKGTDWITPKMMRFTAELPGSHTVSRGPGAASELLWEAWVEAMAGADTVPWTTLCALSPYALTADAHLRYGVCPGGALSERPR